ncbi:RnfH family protein, partial [Burkholderia pseudomallei]
MPKVQVCYALPERQTLVAVDVPAGASGRDAIAAGGVLARHPDIDAPALATGI